MKKTISLMLCIMLLTSVLVPVGFAAEQDAAQMQQVLAMVKERIDIPAEFSRFIYQKNDQSYSFQWSTPADAEKGGDLSVTCTVSGVITNYNCYRPGDGNGTRLALPAVTIEQAKASADAALKRLNPTVYSHLKLKTEDTRLSLYQAGFYFSVVRVENGVEFPANSGSIQMDGTASALASFRLTWWENVAFARPEGAIDQGTAKAAYANEIGLELVYKKKTDYAKRTATVYPAYLAAKPNMVIDAFTGKAIEPTRYFFYPLGRGDATKSAQAADTKFTPEEQVEIDATAGLLSVEQAEQALRSNKLLDLNGTVLKHHGVYSDHFYPTQYRYNLTFQSTDDNIYRYANATLDAKTGAIASYYRDQESSDPGADAPKRQYNDSIKSAFVQMAGERSGQYRWHSTDDRGNTTYYRIVNGIRYLDNSASIQLDENNKKVVSYSINHTDDTFPAIDGVIDSGQAVSRMFEQTDYDLAYLPVYPEGDTLPTQTILVYQRGTDNDVNPFDGTLMDYQGDPLTRHKLPTYTDIEGHYAQYQINALKNAGVYLEGDLFHPDSNINQRDYIALLCAVFQGDSMINSSLDSMYRQFAPQVLLEVEGDPDAPVTREMAAVYLIRAMGGDEYASLKGIYQSPFPDVTTSVGHIAMLYAMGILGGDQNGNFNPAANLSRGDSMIVLYKYLTR